MKKKNLLYIFLTILLTACVSPKKIVYLQNVQVNEQKKIEQTYELKIHEDDLLAITVNSKNPELALPFNLPMIAYQAGKGDQVTSTPQLQGHLVDAKGNIDFPVLGKIQVAGLTRLALSDTIKSLLIRNNYISDPIVTVKLLNYRISVMGEVARPGTFSVSTDRITILEALSMAGDMTIYGKRDRIYVIRESDGQRSIGMLDIRSTDVFSSPFYYLQQNDIVYVEPNKSRAGQSAYNNTLPVLLSGLSILTTILLFILK